MRLFKVTSTIAALLMAVGIAQGFDPKNGDSAQGKEDIIKCRECHDGGKAGKLSPAGKTKKQWGRYFKDDYKRLNKKHPEWNSFGYSTDFLQNIHRFLNDHSLDSDKPQTCD